jgi:hypothetical protein
MPMARRRTSEGNTVDQTDAAKVISDRKLLIISRIMAIPVVAFAIFFSHRQTRTGNSAGAGV